MYKKFLTFALSLSAVSHAWSMTDTLSQRKSINIDEIVITGSRSETDSRRLPSTISVINRGIIDEAMNRHYSLPYPLRYPGFSSPAEAFWATAYRPERPAV